MAREEADREDLLADATAYAQRIQWQIPTWAEPVFVGFRSGGAVSFYFGQDPVYHFNASGELRRLYVDGDLIKADRTRLVRMRRIRSDREVTLQSRELTEDETRRLCDSLSGQLRQLTEALASGNAELQGQVPVEEPISERVLSWLDQAEPIRIARTPRVDD